MAPRRVRVCLGHRGRPRREAGITAGDVITAINGTATPDAQALAQVLAGLHPGQVASVALTRADGSKATVRVTLGQLPAS